MNKINNIHKYAVLWLESQAIEIEDIVKKTGLTQKQILSIIKKEKDKTQALTEKEKIVTSSSQVSANKKSKMKEMMITESIGRRQNVTIMTKSASEIADEGKKTFITNNTSKPYIFKQQ